MPIDDDWKLEPARVYMHPSDFRDMVVDVLRAEGWTDEAAIAEADRRLAELLPPPSEPDPLLLELAKQLEPGES
jgi:hypothetical protein